ncbi:malate transporter [Deltaproteobacteria bacterium]|nr:malate transporter [Deltaproteobacteria bacterium]
MVILTTSATLASLLLVGWFARRRGLLGGESSRELARFVVDVAFPALVVYQLPRTVDAATLSDRWYVPILGAGVLCAGLAVGTLLAPWSTAIDRRPTFAFLVGTPNWLFLPLPIAGALYGDDGVQSVLLANVGAQVTMWTLGVWTLRKGQVGATSLRELVLNPGLLATLVGSALAIGAPHLPEGTSSAHALAPLIEALGLLAGLTVPLSLIVTGAQLAELDPDTSGHAREQSGILLGRLLLTPLVLFALLHVTLLALHAQVHSVPLRVALLIAAMPVAVSCGPMTARYGGPAGMSARAVLYTTVVGLLTAPAVLWLLATEVG